MPNMRVSPGSHDLCADYLEDFQRDAEYYNQANFKSRCNRNTLQMLGILCNVDICDKSRVDGVEKHSHHAGWIAAKNKSWHNCLFGIKPFEHSNWYRKQSFTWLGQLMLYIYFIFSIHVLVNLYYQYSYDFDQMRLARLRLLLNQGHISQHDFNRWATELLVRIESALASLRFLGSPYYNLSIIIECLYLYILIFTFITYCSGYIYYRVISNFDLHFVRELMNSEDEERYSRALIKLQVTRFIESNRMYSKIQAQYFDKTSRHANVRTCQLNNEAGDPLAATTLLRDQAFSQVQVAGLSNRKVDKPRKLHKLLLEDYQIYQIITRMLSSGALKPYNKSPRWAARRTDITFAYQLGNLIYMSTFFCILIKGSNDLRDPNEKPNWNDRASTLSLFTLVGLLLISVNLFATYFTIGSIDQMVMVDKMKTLIQSCIQANTLEFLLLVKENQPTDSPMKGVANSQRRKAVHVDKINANHLFVVMHYKIFVAQYQPTRQTISAVVLFVTLLILLIPLIIKIHMPYLNQLNFSNVKWFAIAFSFLTLIPANFVLVPVCHLHARCLNLYRLLSSLLAHTIEIESHSAGRGIYNKHVVLLIFKELRNLDQFMNRFKMSSLGFDGTYKTLVKTHFWWGIVVLTILVDNQASNSSGQEILSSLLNDPLGVFTGPSKLM